MWPHLISLRIALVRSVNVSCGQHERNIIRYFTKIYNYSFYLMPLKIGLCNVALFSLLIKVKYRVLFTDLFPYIVARFRFRWTRTTWFWHNPASDTIQNMVISKETTVTAFTSNTSYCAQYHHVSVSWQNRTRSLTFIENCP